MSEQEKNREYYREQAPFAADQAEKDAFFRRELKTLTEHHRRSCAAYDDICNGLGEDGPYIPVALFKDLTLASVPQEEVVRQVTSSGTTGQQVSRILLDAPTAELQRWALASITGDFIGGKRMPMLIIDSPDVLRDRSKFTARGAGILGFSMMSSKRFYALDENMQLDMESIEAFREAAAKAGASFAFGFTFMIWAYFVEALRREGRSLDLGNCYLIHGGGWKKLQDQKVSDEEFREVLRSVCGIAQVSDYYGMAEQTGSIFMQCEEGHLHASIYSDIEILDPEDFSPCSAGAWGLIALRSWIPGSYPGHLLLTEDRGRILGTDDCPCGRKGRYFEVSGRIRKAEIRGCSDTFEGSSAGGAGGAEASEGSGALQVLAGDESLLGPEPPLDQKTMKAFDPLVLSFLEELSALFMKDPAYRQYPDIYALGFWLRPAHLKQLQARQEEMWRADASTDGCSGARCGRGLALHIAPSNMPTMFAYSWITALLAGCSSVVRLSAKESEISDAILQGIREVLSRPAFEALRRRNAFVRFPRDHEVLARISEKVSARMIWGGDATVEKICGVPKPEDAIDIGFPDKYSIAVMDAGTVEAMPEEELRLQADRFCRDTYGADQNACSSPRSVFWIGGGSAAKAKERWWDAVHEASRRYELAPWMATEKYRVLCRSYAQTEGLGQVKRRGNRVYTVPCGSASDWGNRSLPEGRLGIFFEFNLQDQEQLLPLLGERIQTAVCIGMDPQDLYEQARRAGCPGLDRAVSAGEALEFDTIWDRKDLITMLTE
ncbi:MAG: hypothetical protein IJ109_04660 [Firmicutes bacterium]|nr:hypothetical protein [Bacillota bacterium]